MNKKQLFIIFGIVALGIVGFFVYNKNKPPVEEIVPYTEPIVEPTNSFSGLPAKIKIATIGTPEDLLLGESEAKEVRPGTYSFGNIEFGKNSTLIFTGNTTISATKLLHRTS